LLHGGSIISKTRPSLAHEKQIRDESTADGTMPTAFHTNVAETAGIKQSYQKLCGTRNIRGCYRNVWADSTCLWTSM